jgi:hypothetical protein
VDHEFSSYQAGEIRKILDDDEFLRQSWRLVEQLKSAKARDDGMVLAPSEVQKELDTFKKATKRLSLQAKMHIGVEMKEGDPKMKGLGYLDRYLMDAMGPPLIDLIMARLDEPYEGYPRHQEKKAPVAAGMIFLEHGIDMQHMTKYLEAILEAAGIDADARSMARKSVAQWRDFFLRWSVLDR